MAKGSLKEIFDHYAPLLEEYFHKKKLEAIESRTSSDSTDDTLRKSYARDARLDLIDEIWADFQRDL